nr:MULTISPECIES: hypothetical protein [unclassified Rhodococcus (in: high G+C Gram-positive bacteria)]
MTTTLEKPLTDEMRTYIESIVDTAPPLTEERRSRITALFRAGAAK